MTLNIALHDGFKNDSVTVSVNGRKVYEKAGVTTDLTISFADSVEIELSEPRAAIEVSVAGGVKGRKDVDVSKTLFVVVRIIEGEMSFLTSTEPFPML